MENMVALPVCLAVALVCSHEIFSLFSRWWSWWIWTPWRGTATWAICSQSREEPPDSVASNVWQWIALPALWKVAWDVKIFLHVFGFLSLFFCEIHFTAYSLSIPLPLGCTSRTSQTLTIQELAHAVLLHQCYVAKTDLFPQNKWKLCSFTVLPCLYM